MNNKYINTNSSRFRTLNNEEEEKNNVDEILTKRKEIFISDEKENIIEW